MSSRWNLPMVLLSRKTAFTLQNMDSTPAGCPRRWRRFATCGRNRVLRSINLVKTPPRVSMPSDSASHRATHILDLAFEHAGLDGGPHGHDFVWIDALMRRFVDECARRFDHARHPVMPPTRTNSSIFAAERSASFKQAFNRRDGAFKQCITELLHFGAREFQAEMLWPLASAVMNGRLISY